VLSIYLVGRRTESRSKRCLLSQGLCKGQRALLKGTPRSATCMSAVGSLADLAADSMWFIGMLGIGYRIGPIQPCLVLEPVGNKDLIEGLRWCSGGC
jgi:hypothetical protein